MKKITKLNVIGLSLIAGLLIGSIIGKPKLLVLPSKQFHLEKNINIKENNDEFDYDQLRLIVKNRQVSLLKNWDGYWVLNNQTGTLKPQTQMNETSETTLLSLYGYDAQNKAYHFMDYHGQNYWWKWDINLFIKNENNYLFDEKIEFSIERKPGMTVKYYLKALYSSDGHTQKILLDKQWWNIGHDPHISRINHTSYSDNIWYIFISTKNDSHDQIWFFDAESEEFWEETDEIEKGFIAKKGQIKFYSDYFVYREHKYYFKESNNLDFGQNDNAIWRDNIDNKSWFVNRNNELMFVDFNNFNREPLVYDSGFELKHTDMKIQQSDDGGYYFINDKGGLVKWNFAKEKVEFVNDNSMFLLIANEEYFVSKDNHNQIIKGSKYLQYGIKLEENRARIFIEDDVFYFDDNNFKIRIENSSFRRVEINGQFVIPEIGNEDVWIIDASIFKDSELTLKLIDWHENTIRIKLKIKKDILPKIIVKELSSEKQLERWVYVDNEVGLVDGFASNYRTIASISDDLVSEVWMNHTKINDWSSFELDDRNFFDALMIIDKFDKNWNYHIYRKTFEPPKYWYETERGIENAKRLESCGFNEKAIRNFNKIESEKYSVKADDVFDLSAIRVDDPDFVSTMRIFWNEINNWYGALLPYGRINLNLTKDINESEKGENLKIAMEKAFIKGLNKWFGDGSGELNHYNTPLTINDIDWNFQITDNETISKDDLYKKMILNGINQDEDTRVTGTFSLTIFIGGEIWEWIELSDFSRDWDYYELSDNVEHKFADYFQNLSEEMKRNATLGMVRGDLEEIILEQFNLFLKSGKYNSCWIGPVNFATELTTLKSNEIDIEFYAEDEEELNKIENLNLKISSPEGEVITIGNVKWENMGNYLYKYGWGKSPDNFLLSWQEIFLFVMIGILILLAVFFVVMQIFRYRKQKHEFEKQIEKLKEK